jgi:hypothetical protein
MDNKRPQNLRFATSQRGKGINKAIREIAVRVKQPSAYSMECTRRLKKGN